MSTYPTDADGNPDGRLLGLNFASAQNKKASTDVEEVENEFYEDEIVGFLARSKSTSNDSVDISYQTRQDW